MKIVKCSEPLEIAPNSPGWISSWNKGQGFFC